MFKWLFGGTRKQQRVTNRGEDTEVWTGTPRGDWTVPHTYFQTPGWRLVTGTSAQMSWLGAFGGTMTFTRDDAPAWTADELDLDAVRRKHRSAARERHGGLVSAEFVEMGSGAAALEVVTKYRHGTGHRFEGRLFIDESPLAYTIAIEGEERETGVRESLVNALRMQLGEIDVFAMMTGPADPATGGRPVPGMQLDPYDSALDGEATYSASDDPRLDELLQTHPLAVIRSSLRWAQATWECATGTTRVRRQPLPASPGPRVVLSDDFFKTLHAMLKKARA
jgi:hypothetical protein